MKLSSNLFSLAQVLKSSILGETSPYSTQLCQQLREFFMLLGLQNKLQYSSLSWYIPLSLFYFYSISNHFMYFIYILVEFVFFYFFLQLCVRFVNMQQTFRSTLYHFCLSTTSVQHVVIIPTCKAHSLSEANNTRTLESKTAKIKSSSMYVLTAQTGSYPSSLCRHPVMPYVT